MDERERAHHSLVAEVREVAAELWSRQHPLVDERPGREARNREIGAGSPFGDTSDHVELALERERIVIDSVTGSDEEMAHHGREQAGVSARFARDDRQVAPAQHDLPFGRHRLLEQLLELAPVCRLLREEAHGDAVPPHRGQIEAGRCAQERIGQLNEDPSSISGLGIRACGTAVLEVLERPQRLRDRVVTAVPVEARHERDAAGIVLEGRVVEPLPPHRARLSPDCWLVRRGESDAGPASAIAGAT